MRKSIFLIIIVLILFITIGCAGSSKTYSPYHGGHGHYKGTYSVAAGDHNSRGIDYARGKKWQQAIDEYNKAISYDPNYSFPYFNRGVAYIRLGNYQKAIASYDKGIALNPNDAKAYFNRGDAYYGLGDNQKAIADYDKAIALDPNYTEALFTRGMFFYFELGDYQKAVADYDKVIALDPNYPDYATAYAYRGLSYKKLGNNNRACEDLRKACELGFCMFLNRAEKEGYCRNFKAADSKTQAKPAAKKAWSRTQMEALFPAPLSGWTAGDVEITEYDDETFQLLGVAAKMFDFGDESTDEPEVYYHLHRQYQKGSQKLNIFITMYDSEAEDIIKAAHADQKLKAALKAEGASPTTVDDLPAVSYTNKNEKGLSILIDKDNVLTIQCAGLYCGDAVERYLKRMDLRMITEFVKFPHQASSESAGTGFKSRLYVEAHPENARIRILNIRPAFYQGIPLSLGRYQVEVSAKGYITQKIWITLEAPMDKGLVIQLGPVSASSTGKSKK